MIKTLIADDEPLIAAGIRTVLESAGDIEVVAVARDGREAVQAARRHHVDVALLDISMPVMDGLAAAAELTGPRVVLLTAFGNEDNVRRAVRQGVSGFVLKACTPEELIRAVRAAHAGQAYLSPAVARQVLDMAAPGGDERGRDAVRRLATLTARETDILALVAQGLSNAQVARRVHMTEASVKTYVSRILAKLNCTNRVQAALLLRNAPFSN
ncbi:LuxR family two component transcriptional regulator [Nonomuraea polychroma]|uniref:LuxR family two component transcriptional regulator n=1 Tax=Nonomuraea polychroma TaxID=46176 RepID=A0A438MHS1_9ACTN|nr:response regulator transcription factor [Nonomuraea polychroma]RVX44981.1 LuxR family two component transcriptional regulator [Nonomuraea polychroma]